MLFVILSPKEKHRTRGRFEYVFIMSVPHPPALWRCYHHPFCQGVAPKKFARQACKIFRALDNDKKLKSKHARSGIPPRALIAKLLTPYIISTSCFDVCVFSSYFSVR